MVVNEQQFPEPDRLLADMSTLAEKAKQYKQLSEQIEKTIKDISKSRDFLYQQEASLTQENTMLTEELQTLEKDLCTIVNAIKDLLSNAGNLQSKIAAAEKNYCPYS